MTYNGQVDHLIINIVRNQPVAEQSDLQKSLKKKGFDIPQATLSRRLKKLKIAKVAGRYQIIESLQPLGLPIVTNIQLSEYGLIVLHTHPGNASSLAYYLDRKYVAFSSQENSSSGILGTIAGDDTILLIIKGKEYLAGVKDILKNEFPYV
ncbi:arginine repressor [Legionella birminghamensis]|uniref:Arginine repressor n=1 Tax=Legionella birminghamensis TaxID=28083 RepID=A0A378IBC0_9GAMM|nr:ArgR family transcriptional regulator [Legionella birminghamensis]KTC75198.1 arginine repressor [Legionella birminghamensis]STX31851.1 argR arginine repressor [Legionella birminghamensis]